MVRREAWIDVVRGFALCLVVALHVTAHTTANGIPPRPIITDVNLVLDGFRMPAIIMVSAILAAGIGSWPWREVARRRVAPLLLIYALWTVIDVTIRAVMSDSGFGSDDVARIALMAFRPDQYTWYLYALAVYLVLARLTRRVPALVLIAIAVVVNIVVMTGLPYAHTVANFEWWYYVGEHWVFFVAAQRFALQYRALAAAATPARAGAALAVFATAGFVAVRLGIVTNPAVILLLSIAGTGFALLAAPLVAERRWLGWARAVGTNSLGVYVIHSWMGAMVGLVLVSRVHWFHGASVVVPATATLLTIAASYWLTRLIQRVAPVPLLRPWWSTTGAPTRARQSTVATPAQ